MIVMVEGENKRERKNTGRKEERNHIDKNLNPASQHVHLIQSARSNSYRQRLSSAQCRWSCAFPTSSEHHPAGDTLCFCAR